MKNWSVRKTIFQWLNGQHQSSYEMVSLFSSIDRHELVISDGPVGINFADSFHCRFMEHFNERIMLTIITSAHKIAVKDAENSANRKVWLRFGKPEHMIGNHVLITRDLNLKVGFKKSWVNVEEAFRAYFPL